MGNGIKWIGFIFVGVTLLSLTWSFAGLLTEKKWVRISVVIIIGIISVFIINKMQVL